jgi:hypothetical protein
MGGLSRTLCPTRARPADHIDRFHERALLQQTADPSAGVQQTAMLGIAGLPHAKFHLMTGLHPARAKCAAHVAGSDNPNIHRYRLFDIASFARALTCVMTRF